MMTSEEYLRCIKKLNPEARAVIWQQSPESEFEVKWDDAHTGIKPTPEQCEAVLAEVQAEIVAENRVKSLTMRQARLQMLAMGVLSQVEAAVAQAGDSAQIEWEYAQTVERDYPLFLSIKTLLGFTDEQEETFFSEGSLL